eukprot:1142849-Pelagomonas_calceolata.AAC.4
MSTMHCRGHCRGLTLPLLHAYYPFTGAYRFINTRSHTGRLPPLSGERPADQLMPGADDGAPVPDALHGEVGGAGQCPDYADS